MREDDDTLFMCGRCRGKFQYDDVLHDWEGNPLCGRCYAIRERARMECVRKRRETNL